MPPDTFNIWSVEPTASLEYPPFAPPEPRIISPVAVVVTPLIFTVSLAICNVLPTFTLSVVPDLERPSPASTAPAPENCVNVNAVLSRVMSSFVVSTYPWSAFAVPSSTNTNKPEVTSALALASAALAGEAPAT